MDAICATPAFQRSKRAGQLLRYLVSHSLDSSNPDKLKEYTIAVDVFEKPATFDARLDASIRVAVIRLRARLDIYYRQRGETTGLRISIPVGEYVAQFQWLDTPPPETNEASQGKPIEAPSLNDHGVEIEEVGQAVSPLESTPAKADEGLARPVSEPGTSESGAETPETTGVPGPVPVSKWGRPWALGGAILAAVAGIWLFGHQLTDFRKETAGANSRFVKLQSAGPFEAYPALSVDGSWLAYVSADPADGQLQLWRAERRSPAKRELLTRGGCPKVQPAISPDGKWIAYREDCAPGGVYIIPSQPGHSGRLIARFGKDPSFSPDGNNLVYWVQDPQTRFGRVYVAPLDRDLEPLPIAREFDDAHGAVWSPDIKFILICGTGQAGSATEEHDFWLYPEPDANRQISRTARKLGVFASLQRLGLRPHPSVLSRAQFAWSGRDLILPLERAGRSALWRISFDADWKLKGDPEKVFPDEAGITAHPASSQTELSYSKLAFERGTWEIPVDHASGKITGDPVKLTTRDALGPSASRNGDVVTYLEPAAGGAYSLRALLRKGGNTDVDIPIPASTRRTRVTADGERVYYRVLENGPVPGIDRQAIYYSRPGAREYKRICEDCGPPTDVSADGRTLLYEVPNSRNRIAAIDLPTSNRWMLLQHPLYSVLGGTLSPNGKWVAFAVDQGLGPEHIYLAPFSQGREITQEKWIGVETSDARADSPQWSPDSRYIYFLSDVDGWICVWRREIDPGSGKPVGDKQEVISFHDHRLSPYRFSNQPRHLIGLTVTERSILLSLLKTDSSVVTVPKP